MLMQVARSKLVRESPFLEVENWLPEWPGVRALMEMEIPKHVKFQQSPTDANVMEIDYGWAQHIWAMAPTQQERDVLEIRYALVLKALEPCFPSFDFERFVMQKMQMQTYMLAAELMLSHDRHCESLAYPTYMELWLHLLGIKQSYAI